MKQVQRAMAGVLVAAGVGGMSLAQESAPQTPIPAAIPKWAETITFKGDLRYRNETIWDDSKRDSDGDTYTRQRDRIRARLGATAKVNDNLKAGLELSTGQADPVSGNQSLGDGFGKKEFRLSLAYLDYSFLEDDVYSVHGIAGKMKNPFITFPEDLVWDGDLTPEGLALNSKWGGDFATLYANAGYLWVQERSDTDDLMLYAGQLAAKFKVAPTVGLTVGASYYGFQDIQGYDVYDWESKNNAYGNSTISGTVSGGSTNKAWATDFTPVVYFVKLDLQVAGKPLALFAQELSNIDADRLDQGHMYGVVFGKAKSVNSWEVGYSYAELEKDATVGMFTDSDRWGGGTDGSGHRVFGKFQLMKNLQAAVTYLVNNERKISDSAATTDYDRLQIDLVASF